MKNKKVTVIIVTFNGAFWIEKCLLSLRKSNDPIEIIVVDNLSTDETITIAEKFSNITLIKNTENSGFGAANNIGIKRALENQSDYVFLLNQDTWIFENTISNLVLTAEKNPQIGILSPMHFAGNKIDLDEKFKVYYDRKIAIEKSSNLVFVPFINAAAWLISSDCLKKVGFFEPLFSHYGEDNDFCRRVLFHNFKIGIDENSKICHDRKIIRSYKKDLLQAKLQVLFFILDFNNSLLKSYFLALKSVIGSMKYYSKFYSISEICNMFFVLVKEYITLVFSITKMQKVRIAKTK
ncbi:MAG: glycosyltransferase family 2 protein [Flavobacterium sp.]|nr:glycosyltransferase family 2 protein [Flavobacterium sp.]